MDVTYKFQGIIFEWDHDKALANLDKHALSFESACEVFFDPFLQLLDEEEFVEGELRQKVIGLNTNWQLLYVVYVLRDDKIRIISARYTMPHERKHYENE